jgi:hypothetical protein
MNTTDQTWVKYFFNSDWNKYSITYDYLLLLLSIPIMYSNTLKQLCLKYCTNIPNTF